MSTNGQIKTYVYIREDPASGLKRHGPWFLSHLPQPGDHLRYTNKITGMKIDTIVEDREFLYDIDGNGEGSLSVYLYCDLAIGDF